MVVDLTFLADGAKAVAKTDAFKTVQDAAASRVRDDLKKAKGKVQDVTQQVRPVVERSEQTLKNSLSGLNNALNDSGQRTVQRASNALQNFTGNAIEQGSNLAAKAVTLTGNVRADVNNVVSGGVDKLTTFIAPTQTGN